MTSRGLTEKDFDAVAGFLHEVCQVRLWLRTRRPYSAQCTYMLVAVYSCMTGTLRLDSTCCGACKLDVVCGPLVNCVVVDFAVLVLVLVCSGV
jgi:hypothetical protein